MHDHQKLQKILDVRKQREAKALKKYEQKRQELAEYEEEINKERANFEQFMQKRTVDLHAIQNRIKTEAVNGLVFEQYLSLKDDTQKQIEKKYADLEEQSKGYQPILDEVNQLFKEWEDIKKGQSRLQQTIDKKTVDFNFEKEQEIEKKMFDDFVHRPK